MKLCISRDNRMMTNRDRTMIRHKEYIPTRIRLAEGGMEFIPIPLESTSNHRSARFGSNLYKTT